MIYGSVCSGIEAASVAWHLLGWEAAFVSEIDNFPRAVLAHHYPEVPLHGDFTTIQDGDYRPIDLLVGGTPCQSFSIAGLRGGLDDDRGNLALEYLRLADRLRPKWVVWENVPGVFSSASHEAPDTCPPEIDLDCCDGPQDGEEVVVEDSYDADESHALSCFLAGLSELGYGFAYRVLDAQFFGLAQRRKRVFVVGYLGDWRRAAAVLFEPEGLRGDSAPSRKAREGIAGGFETGVDGSHCADIAPTINAAFGNKQGLDNQHIDGGAGLFVAQTFSIMPMNSGKDYKARAVDVAQPIMAGGPVGGNQGGDVVVAFGAQNSSHQGDGVSVDFCPTLDKSKIPGVMKASAVRRLTPTECERLQGFPDGYTLIPYRGKPASDGPRYKALGNSMAVPVMGWIGKRIQIVDKLP